MLVAGNLSIVGCFWSFCRILGVTRCASVTTGKQNFIAAHFDKMNPFWPSFFRFFGQKSLGQPTLRRSRVSRDGNVANCLVEILETTLIFTWVPHESSYAWLNHNDAQIHTADRKTQNSYVSREKASRALKSQVFLCKMLIEKCYPLVLSFQSFHVRFTKFS